MLESFNDRAVEDIVENGENAGNVNSISYQFSMFCK